MFCIITLYVIDICTLINLLSQQSSCNHYFFRGNHITLRFIIISIRCFCRFF